MSRRLFKRIRAAAACAVLAGALVALPFTPIGTPQVAHAAVTSGSIVYTTRGEFGSTAKLKIHAPNGTITTIADVGTDNGVTMPMMSPDGSKITFSKPDCPSPDPANDPNVHTCIAVINSDGSNLTLVTHPSSTNGGGIDHRPTWSPDGQWVAFVRAGSSAGNSIIFKVKIDGSSLTRISPDPSKYDEFPAWSPDGKKIAFDRLLDNQTSLHVMNTDGTGLIEIPSQPSAFNWEAAWAPNSTRLYFQSLAHGFANIDGINVDGSHFAKLTADCGCAPDQPAVSPDGTKVAFNYGADFDGIYQVPTDGSQTITSVVKEPNLIHEWPTFVKTTYPAPPPSNAALAINAPSYKDNYGMRGIKIKLSTTGVKKWQYGWSKSATTAPNTAYLQESTNVSAKTGTLNFLGKYSGSSTTWNGGTQPDQDWYLWIRSVNTSNIAGAWNTNKLKVHTPKRGIWVADGDSTSSGHNQLINERGCPTAEDSPIWLRVLNTIPCSYTGAPHIRWQDPTYSWANGAVIGFNQSRHLPAAWAMEYRNIAISGTPTYKFGVVDQTPGTDAWAADGTQAGQLRSTLYQRSDSWNITSTTGGANNSNWGAVLAEWYANHFVLGGKPWAVTNVNGCPDTQSIWNSLATTPIGSNLTVNQEITADIKGMATVATKASPGVRFLNVGVHYTVDSTNVCFNDNAGRHGVKSIVDQLNADHTAVTGTNVRYVNVASAIGTSPVSGGKLQLTELYGYPHWSGTGQAQVSSAAQAVLNSAW